MMTYVGIDTAFAVKFSRLKTGLTTVGFTLVNVDATEYAPRSTVDVVELGNGSYCTHLLFTESWQGVIQWDTGETIPVFAYEDVNAVEDVLNMETPGAYASGTAGFLIGQLSLGLWVSIPNPETTNTQTLVIVAKELGENIAVGDLVTITPVAGQVVGITIISTEKKYAVIGSNGIAQYNGMNGIPVDMGVRINVQVGNYYNRTITVDTVLVKNITAYA